MIKFAPFVEYKMDECYLNEAECVGLIMRQMAGLDTDRSRDILKAVCSGPWAYRFDSDKNQTEYEFGSETSGNHYDYTAYFNFTSDREYLEMRIYVNDPLDGHMIYFHRFDDEEMMGCVDYRTYKDGPKRLEDHWCGGDEIDSPMYI